MYISHSVASVSSGCHAPRQCSTVIRVVDFTAMKGTRARNYTNEVINRGKQMIESGRSRTRYNLRKTQWSLTMSKVFYPYFVIFSKNFYNLFPVWVGMKLKGNDILYTLCILKSSMVPRIMDFNPCRFSHCLIRRKTRYSMPFGVQWICTLLDLHSKKCNEHIRLSYVKHA